MVRLPGMPEPMREVIAKDLNSRTVMIRTGPCMVCGKTGTVVMPIWAWEKYDDGRGQYIQQAWPEGSAGEREQLINGTHPECFEKIFPPEEDDDGFVKFDLLKPREEDE